MARPNVSQPALREGWYPDPFDQSRLRLWDGVAWTDKVMASPRPRHRRGLVALVLLCVLSVATAIGRSPAHPTALLSSARGEPSTLAPVDSGLTAPGGVRIEPPVLPLDQVAEPGPRSQAANTGGAPSGVSGLPIPAYRADFPDPSLIVVGGKWWAFGTGAGTNVRSMSSPDGRSWTAEVEALPAVAPWAQPGSASGPSVVRVADEYLLYYSVRHAATGRQCASVAVSGTVEGPFSDATREPLVCEGPTGRPTRPFPYIAPDHSIYLLWVGDAGGRAPATLRAQRLTPDGMTLTERSATLLTAGESWQGGTFEAPSMVRAGSRYLLVYGAGAERANSAIGFASCDAPLGPCRDQSIDQPWKAAEPGVLGPHSPDVFVDPAGRGVIAFTASAGGGPDRALLWIQSLRVEHGVPQAF